MQNISRVCLVLNGSYEPVNVVTARRAMIMLCKGSAVVMERSKHIIRTSTVAFPLPSVIRLLNYCYVPRHARAVSRRSIFLRDNYRCQYCMVVGNGSTLTLDHVMPKSRGGKNDWTNLVAACLRCNNKKSNRTPEEAGMTLAMKPRPFGMHARHKQAAANDSAWDKYLFY